MSLATAERVFLNPSAYKLLGTLGDFQQLSWDSCQAELPAEAGAYLYVIAAELNALLFPFYVGQTNRIRGRHGDYITAQFAAPTDFRVGAARKYFSGCGAAIHFFYKSISFASSGKDCKHEKALIRSLLLEGFPLLNAFPAFEYQESTPESERKAIEEYCQVISSTARCR